MLSDREQKAIVQGIDKVSSKVDNLDTKFTSKIDNLDSKFTAQVDKLDSKIDDLDKKFTTKVDDLDKKFSKIETVLQGIEKILEEQSKRMTAIETRTNFQQNWFLSIQTLLAGAIITALIKVSF